jgi:hypothetical protein
VRTHKRGGGIPFQNIHFLKRERERRSFCLPAVKKRREILVSGGGVWRFFAKSRFFLFFFFIFFFFFGKETDEDEEETAAAKTKRMLRKVPVSERDIGVVCLLRARHQRALT